MEEWTALYKSKSGERGIFNREAAQKQVEKANAFRTKMDPEYRTRDADQLFGTNPCSEIILRDREFCNLTEVIVREDDTPKSLARKVKLATILGTWQSTLLNFRFISGEWKKNCEEERLLGVSLTGIMDAEVTRKVEGLDLTLQRLRSQSIKVNKEHADILGIPQSAAITCVKPSGTVSQLTDAASGIHARHNAQYIRTVRADNKDPLCSFMKDKGFPHEADVMKPDHVTVFSFPIQSPAGCVTRNDMTAIEQLELWLVYQRHWCEHKPSVTITVKEEEWPTVGGWVYDHFDEISGISFLPHSDHSYRQAPYQDCTWKEYEEMLKKMPVDIDWSGLGEYEKEDNTSGSQTMACSGNSCEIVDLTN
jgi:ribonucleoside-diphosphate reductase alpha chain